MRNVKFVWKKYCKQNISQNQTGFKELFNYDFINEWILKKVETKIYPEDKVTMVNLLFQIKGIDHLFKTLGQATDTDHNYIIDAEEQNAYRLGELLDLTVDLEDVKNVDDESRYIIGRDNIDVLMDVTFEYRLFLKKFASYYLKEIKSK